MGRAVLLLGPALWVIGVNVVPLIEMARISLIDAYPASPGHVARYSLDNYVAFVASPIYRPALLRSFAFAGLTTILALLLAYPLAYAIAIGVPAHRRLRHLLLLIAPFWTSEIVRIFAIMLLLANRGAVNGALRWAGIIDDPLPLLYNQYSLVFGMLQLVLLAMLLPLYAALQKLPRHLLEAAAGMGARPWTRLIRVTLPLTREGIASGCSLVFLISLGAFAVPTLLGGADTTLFSMTIGSMFASSAGRWPLGAAFGLILLFGGLGVAGIVMYLMARRRAVA
jgi:spermidine/putrescine transport system permease protein